MGEARRISMSGGKTRIGGNLRRTVGAWFMRGRSDSAATRMVAAAMLVCFAWVCPAVADSGHSPVVFQSQTFVRTNGNANTYTATFKVRSWVVAPFNMHIQNGDPNGRERASSVTVTLNGTQVLGPSNLNGNVGTLDIPVSPIVGVNTLQVTMDGQRGSEVTITIWGTNADQVAPTVTVVTPANGSDINTATPKIEITYTKPQGESGDDHADCDETTLKITIDGVDRTSLFTIRKGDASATIPPNLALTAGTHTIVATLYDEARNQGSATSTFTVDLTPATIQVVQPALGAYLNTTTPTIVIQYSDNNGVNLNTLKVLVNGNDLTSLFTKTNTGATATLPAANALAQGAVQIVAQIQDLAGNQATASSSFNIDTTPPTISITHPAANSYRGSPTVPVVVQYADDQAIDTSKLAITIDGVALTPTGVTATGANATASGVANGAHVLVATIKDLAGNIGTSQITFYVDTSIPTIHVVQPAPGSLLNASTPAVTVTYTDAVGVDTSTLKIYVNGADATSLFTVTSSSATAQLTAAFALPDGQNTINAQIANLAGTVGTATSSFTVDTTPPTIAIQAPPARTNSNTPTTTIVYSDATSGVDPYSLVVTLDGSNVSTLVAPGANSATGVLQLNPPLVDGTHQLSATVKDRAGNQSQQATLSFLVDTKPPSISFTTPANNSFINNATPSITLQYSDGSGTGVDPSSVEIFLQQGSNQPTDITNYFQVGAQQATGAIPSAISLNDGTYVLSAVVSDVVGNPANAAATFVVDTVPPTATIQSPAANAILNTATVPVTITYSDDRSGIDTTRIKLTVDGTSETSVLTATATQATGTLPVLADGTHTVQLTVYDRSGNALNPPISQQFTTDTTPPTILVVVSPAPNAAGWNNTPVTITFSCADSGSGVTACPSPVAVATEGAGQTFCGQAQDAAGNTSAPACATVNLDFTPPAITYTVNPAPNGNGIITTTPVTITFSCTDALSGVATCNAPITVSNPGMSQMFTGTATDVAGNSATAKVTLNIQTVAPTPPAIIAAISPAPNAKGWNNSNVTVTFTCTAGTNPISSCASPVALSSEGAGQQVCGKAIDTTSLSSTACATVNVDKTPPVITAAASPAPSLSGWNTAPVTVTFNCSDALSGIATCPSLQTISTDGINQTIKGTAVDVAGNSSTAAQVTLNIDQTPPTILQFSAPSQLAPGQSGTITVAASDNIAVASVVIQMGGTTIATLTAPPYTASFNLPTTATDGSTVTLTATAYDAAGNASSSARGVQVVPSGVVTGQVLSDATGLPFVGATVQVIGGSGQDTSDGQGRYSIASNVPSLYLSITAAANQSTGTGAMINLDRQVTLQSGVGTVPVDARMTPIAAPVSITPSGGTLTAGNLIITVAPNAVSAATNFHLTSLSQQGLPGLLPLGWSPVSAFDLRADTSTTTSFSAAFAQLPASATLHLVQYNYNSHNWLMVAPNLTATSGALTVTVPSVGDFALVVTDVGSGAPTVPTAGHPLTGVSMVSLPAGAAATGTLSPPSAAPTGGTSTATLAVQSSVPLPSGTVIQANVSETYALTSGKKLSSPKRTEDILLYQYSAPTGAAAVANFPVTPSQTFQPGQLSSGDVHLDILSGRESIRGQVGGSDAATVSGGDATLTIAAGSLPQDTAISVSPESVDTFLPTTTSLIPLAEYNVDFSGQTLLSPAQLSVAPGTANPGDNLLLAQVQRINDVPYLVVVSLAQVNGASMVTQAASGLSGITQGGDYVFYKLTSPTGYVSGTVTASSGPVAAMVQTDGLPFVTFANFSGSYLIPALAGTVNLTATVLNTAISGTATVQVTAGQSATANIAVTAQTETATVTPANGAVGIPLTAEIDITAPDPFNQSTVTTTSVTLSQNGSGSSTPVPIRFVFSEGGMRLSVFPQSALQPSTTYTLTASGIANTVGGLISIPAITFTTQAITPPTFNANALVFGMPDQNGNSAISAPAGSFPAGTTILIVDQTNGVVLTLSALNDGSVSGEMPATINDVLQVTITAPDKTTTTFVVSQFVAADGTTAVGPGGGTVAGPNGTGLIIPQGATDHGVTFKLSTFDQTKFPDGPDVDNLQFGSGLQVQVTNAPLTYNNEIKLVFPVPPGATAGAHYYVYRRTVFQDGTVGYESIDEAKVQGTGPSAQVVTASFPFSGYISETYDYAFNVAANAYTKIVNGIDYFYLTYMLDPLTNVYSQGAITGRVTGFQYPNGSPTPVSTPIPGARVYSSKNLVVSQTDRKSVFAYTQPAGSSDQGRYTLWDPRYLGGSITVNADQIPANFLPTGATAATQYSTTAFEVTSTDSIWSFLMNGLLGHYRNVAVGDIAVPAPPAPAPPPAFQITIMQVNNGVRTATSGIVTIGSPLVIGVNSLPGSTVGVGQNTTIYINGQNLTVKTSDPQGQFAAYAEYSPALAGVYTAVVTVPNPFGGTPFTASNTFRAIAGGGGVNTTTTGVAPGILTGQSYPVNGSTQVPVTVNPVIAFTEPVTIPANSVQLQDNANNVIASQISGVDKNGAVYQNITQAPSGTAFTSITIQPSAELRYSSQANDPNGTYKIFLSAAIKDLNSPPLALVAGSGPIVFTTYQIPVLSNGNAAFASPGIFVAKDRAYVAKMSNIALSFVWQYDVSDPSSPKPIQASDQGAIEGRADDVEGQDSNPVAGGNTLIAVSEAPYPPSAGGGFQNSNVYIYKGTSAATPGGSDSLTLLGAASLTQGPTDGVVASITVNGTQLYAATWRKGIQIVDLNQIVTDFGNAGGYIPPSPDGAWPATHIYGLLNEEGQGFGQDAVIGTIPVGQTGHEYCTELNNIKSGTYTMPGGTSSTLAVATGLVLVPSPTNDCATAKASFVVADVNAISVVAESLLQSPTGDVLTRGQALSLGQIQTATGSLNIAAVVGTGTGAASTLLFVVDMTNPASPKVLSSAALGATPTDVVLNGNTAIVGYSTDTSELFDLTNPASLVSLGLINGVGGKLFFYNGGLLFSTGAVAGVASSPLGGIHAASFNSLQLSWQAMNSPLDANPNAGGGLRIFPDKQTPTDTTNRSLVRLVAQVKPAAPGVTVNFRVFDVPDPSVPNAPANDNNGTPNYGTLSAGSAITDSTGTATVTFATTMQPGDNFMATASTNKSQSDGVIVTAQGLQDAAGHSLPDGVVSVTPMLTVWRRMHVEVDSMSGVTGNTLTGNITGYAQNKLTVDTNLNNGSRNLDSNPPGNGRFENGYITAANAMVVAVQANGVHHVDSANGFAPIAQAQMAFTAVNGQANTAGNSMGFAPAGANWTFSVQVPHANPATAWAALVGGTMSIAAGPAMTITAVQDTGTVPQNPAPGVQQFDTAQITVSNLAIPFSLVDDDQAVMPTLPDTSFLATAYGDAYIFPLIDGGQGCATNATNACATNANNKTIVAFQLNNVTNNGNTILAAMTVPNGLESDANRADNFWVTYVLSAYQAASDPTQNSGFPASPRDDGDPDDTDQANQNAQNPQSPLGGVTDQLNGKGSLVFVETVRDQDHMYGYAVPSMPRVVAHEIGHQCGLPDRVAPAHGLMTADIYNNAAVRLNADDIKALKARVKSCGVQ